MRLPPASRFKQLIRDTAFSLSNPAGILTLSDVFHEEGDIAAEPVMHAA